MLPLAELVERRQQAEPSSAGGGGGHGDLSAPPASVGDPEVLSALLSQALSTMAGSGGGGRPVAVWSLPVLTDALFGVARLARGALLAGAPQEARRRLVGGPAVARLCRELRRQMGMNLHCPEEELWQVRARW